MSLVKHRVFIRVIKVIKVVHFSDVVYPLFSPCIFSCCLKKKAQIFSVTGANIRMNITTES